MAKQYELKGINNDGDTCGICGKTNLKRVMWLAVLDDDGNETGAVIPAGTTCGARALGLTGKYSTQNEVKEALEDRAKFNSCVEQANELSKQFNDDIVIIKNPHGFYSTVRGMVYDKNPRLYGYPVHWVTLH